MGKEAEIILRIKERRLFAAMSQETLKAGSEVRENEGVTFLEHGLATKVYPCGSQGVAIALGPEARKAWEREGSLRITLSVRESWQHDSPSWTSSSVQSASSSRARVARTPRTPADRPTSEARIRG